MEEKHVACLCCRIRRRKCDASKPVCSGCSDLNIPPDLCVYHDARVGYKANKSRKTLQKLKNENNRLKKELEFLKAKQSTSQVNLQPKKFDNSINDTLPYYMSANGRLKKNPLLCLTGETYGTPTHYGPISWVSLISNNAPLKHISLWFMNVIKMEKDKYDSRNFMNNNVEKDTILKKIRKSIDDNLFGLPAPRPLDLLNRLLFEIGDLLPSKAVFDQILPLYFHLSDQKMIGFVCVDPEHFYEQFNQYVLLDSKGKLSFVIDQDFTCVPFVSLLLSLLGVIDLFLTSNKPDARTQKPGPPQELLYDYFEALILADHLNRGKPSSIIDLSTPEILQSLVHWAVFDRHVPQGRRQQGLVGISDLLATKQLITYARLLNLDKDLTVYYPDKTESYRRSLTSIWIFLAYIDFAEGLETGISLKIKPEELELYINDHEPYVKTVVIMHRVLNEFNTKAVEITGQDMINLIMRHLMPQLDHILGSVLTSTASDLQYFTTCDFNNIANAPTYARKLRMSTIKLLAYSLSESLLEFGAKFSAQHGFDSTYFEMLAIKRGAAGMKYLELTVHAVKRLIEHKNSQEFSLMPALRVMNRMFMNCARRSVFHVGDLVIRNSDAQYTYQVLQDLLSDTSKYEKSYMEAILPGQRYEIFTYDMSELEDLSYERDINQMRQRLGHLFTHKFLIFRLCRLLLLVGKVLDHEKLNFSFVKLNYVFFYSMTVANLLFSLAFPPDDRNPYNLPTLSDPESLSNNAAFIATSQEPQDFNFNEMFQKFIDTTSQEFDLKSFFTGYTDLYELDDFDRFFQKF